MIGVVAACSIVAGRWLPRDVSATAISLYVAFVAFTLVALGWAIGSRVDNLEECSVIDPGTGIGNRRLFDSRLPEEIARAARQGTSLALLVIDVDHLKTINDTSGHQAGDAAIREVAECIRLACRRPDVAARYGGDEFVVLAPDATAAQALRLANRIRRAVAKNNLKSVRGDRFLLSVSIGVADLCAVPCPEADAFFQAADRALYLAKQDGRNRVVVADAAEVTVTLQGAAPRLQHARPTLPIGQIGGLR